MWKVSWPYKILKNNYGSVVKIGCEIDMQEVILAIYFPHFVFSMFCGNCLRSCNPAPSTSSWHPWQKGNTQFRGGCRFCLLGWRPQSMVHLDCWRMCLPGCWKPTSNIEAGLELNSSLLLFFHKIKRKIVTGISCNFALYMKILWYCFTVNIGGSVTVFDFYW